MRKSVAGGIERDVWLIALVVAMGSVMSILAVTIVNVALERLSVELHSPLGDIQWVATGYLLGMGAVIPTTAWVARRAGARRMYLASLGLFVGTSVLCALAWSAPALIGFRVLQGIAGGLTLPLGQMMLASAAGPQRMARVMSVIGVPMVLGPMAGPIVGGLLIDHLSWHFIFVINVPFGLAALALGAKLLPKVDAATATARDVKLDVRGLVLMCAGVPLLIFGLSKTSSAGGFASPSVVLPALAGAVLIALFAVHAMRAEQPLLNVRLLANRGFAAASAATFCAGAALYGAMLLLPLYFQVVRGEDALHAGLLLIPQGIGAAIAMAVAGRVADRIGGGKVAVAGLAIMAAATVPLAGIDASTSYWSLSAVLLVRGLGTGASVMPLMAAAYSTLRRADIADATPQLNVLQRVGGSIGTSLLTVVLSHQISAQLPGAGGGTSALGGPVPAAARGPLAAAFAHSYVWAVSVTVFAVLPAVYLAFVEHRERERRAGLHVATDGEILPSDREAEQALAA